MDNNKSHLAGRKGIVWRYDETRIVDFQKEEKKEGHLEGYLNRKHY